MTLKDAVIYLLQMLVIRIHTFNHSRNLKKNTAHALLSIAISYLITLFKKYLCLNQIFIFGFA